MTARRSRIALALTAVLAFQAATAASQDTLARAKELYGSAAYDEALSVLDRLQVDAQGDVATEVALYRVFCLLVLERSDEATQVIEEIVTADPFYVPSDDQASPRIRSVFQEVRRSLLPGIAQRWYAEAKAAFAKKDPTATARFNRVIELLDHPDMQGAAMAELRTIAAEFRDLSEAVTSTAEAAAQERAAAAPAAAPVPAVPSAATVVPPVAQEGDPGVSPAVAVSQPMPHWTPEGRDARQVFAGILEVLIDEQGNVTSASMREPVHPVYDAAVLRAARTWKFTPASREGAPTKFLKVIRIRLAPPS